MHSSSSSGEGDAERKTSPTRANLGTLCPRSVSHRELGRGFYRAFDHGRPAGIHHHHPKLMSAIAVETVDHPSDPQIVAYARKYFNTADRMQPQTP